MPAGGEGGGACSVPHCYESELGLLAALLVADNERWAGGAESSGFFTQKASRQKTVGCPPEEPSSRVRISALILKGDGIKSDASSFPFGPLEECVNFFLLEPFTGGQENSCELNQACFTLLPGSRVP